MKSFYDSLARHGAAVLLSAALVFNAGGISAPGFSAAAENYAVEEAGIICGAFEVVGGTADDYSYADGVLKIKSETALTIRNTDPDTATTTDRIEVADNISANITLSGVSIDVSGIEGAAAFKIADNSSGNVTVTLEGTNTLTSGANCAGLQKNGTSGTLTITGSGSLTAQGGDQAAGIGGGLNGSGTGIRITGGTIKAKGGSTRAYSEDGTEVTGNIGGAGIGGGVTGSGTVTISGSADVTAQGAAGAAGIGAGYCRNISNAACGTVTIEGGTVIAIGGLFPGFGSISGAGIGAGPNSHADVTITGGTVTATGGNDGIGKGYGGAGIGSSGGSGNATVKISGGTVIAKGGDDKYGGAGIGGGADSDYDANITISGGVVTATGGSGVSSDGSGGSGAGIGLHAGGKASVTFSTGTDGNAFITASSITDNADTTNWRGVIIQGTEGKVYGSQTLNTDVEIPSGATLTIPADSPLTVAEGVELTINGTLNVANGANLFSCGTITNSSTIDNSGTLTVNEGAVLNNNGSLTVEENASLTNNGSIIGSGTISGNGSCTTSQVTADMISVPTDLFYTGESLAGTILDRTKIILGGKEFTPIDWNLSVITQSDLLYTVKYFKDGEPNVTKDVIVGKSGTEITANSDQPYYTYGDTITVTATAELTGKAPEAAMTAAAGFTLPTTEQMAVFYNDKQISAAVSAIDGKYTMIVSTIDLIKAGALCGSETLTVKFVGNDKMADATGTVEVTINKAKLTITGATIAEKTYDGTTTAEVTSVTFDGLVAGSNDSAPVLDMDFTATAEFDSENAGTDKTVTITVIPNTNEARLRRSIWDSYELESDTFTLTDQKIEQADQTLDVPETSFEKTYGDSEFSLNCTTNGDGEISYEVSGGEDVISVSRSGDVKIIGIGSAEVTVTLAEGTNYTGEDSETISIIVAKGAVDVPAADNTNFTYNGTEQTYQIAASDLYTVEGNKKKNAGSYIVKVTLNDPDHYEWKTELPVYEFVINKAEVDVPKADNTTFIYNGKEQTYTIAQSDLYTVTNNTRTNAGSQTITVTLKDTANYKWKTELPTYTFEIKKAAVTVTADSFTISVGGDIPDPTYTSEGLKGEDKIDDIGANITIRYEKDEIPSGVGEYKIVVSGKAETTNYKITYVDGTLTISDKPVVADPVINPNGGTFSSSQTVTITCDTEGAEIYYTTDGKDPTTASKKYEGAFKVTKTTTVKAIAVMNGTEKSAVVSARFTIDRESTPPVDPGRPRPTDPTEPTDPKTPKINGEEFSWADTIAQINKLSDGEKLTVELNGNTTVPADVIVAIANKDAVITFVLNAEISFVVDGAKISGKVSAADLSVGLSKTMLSTTNFRVIGGTAEKQFTLGNIDIPAKMSFALNKTNAGKFASLMKLNSTTGKYEFVSAAKITADGTALVGINGKGDYLLIVDTETKKPGDLNNDMITNALDASELLKSIVYELSMNSFKADYNIDGTATAMDASEILKAVVG